VSSLARVCINAILLSAASPAWAADAQFFSTLDPAPMTMATRFNVVGSGSITGSLSGNTLKVEGSFSGLASPATGAHLRAGSMTGVPGDVFADLTVSQADNGTLSGSVILDKAKLKALKAGAIYVQIDSVKAPDGTLRAWLLAL
jgi:hypothetical protein